MTPSDLELLQHYAQDRPGSEAAFAALVARHVNLVYSVARRHLSSSPLAEDVTQSVFVELARHAPRFNPATPVVAWLHLVSRRKAVDAVRRESRRLARERAAAEIAAMPPAPPSWPAIEPLLDEAVEALPAPDRTAILLRFFENKSLREVGGALGTSDDAAQKRVARALDQLRAFLARRGVTVSAATLAADLSAHAVRTAPSSLGAAISAAAGSSAPAAIAGGGKFLTMTMFQQPMLVLALALAGSAIGEAVALQRGERETDALLSSADALALRVRAARQQLDADRTQRDATQRQLAATSAMPATDPAIAAEMAAWLERIATAKRLAAQRPELTIPEMNLLTDEDWFNAGERLGSASDETAESILARLRQRAKNRFALGLQAALDAYVVSHAGVLPTDPQQLNPYFDPPADPSMLARYAVVQHGSVTDLPSADRAVLITEKPSENEDTYVSVGAGLILGGYDLSLHARRALREYAAGNRGTSPPNDPTALLPYFNPPLSSHLRARFLRSPERFLATANPASPGP